MKVLLIGGSGNISPAIAKELLAMGAEVTVFNRGNHEVPGTKQIIGDRYETESFIEKVKDYEFDCVIDQICYHPKDAQALVDAFAGKIKQLVFCSTVNTYVAPAKTYPITEESEIGADPAFTYAYDKVLCEKLLQKAAAEGAFELTIIRPGATGNDTSLPIALIGDGRGLIYRMLNKKPIIVMGDGSSLWAMAHRDDVGKAIAHAVLNEKAYGEGYTIASEQAMTWEEYFDIAAKAFGAPKPTYVHMPWEVIVQFCPEEFDWVGVNFRFNNIYSSAKAKRDLGFEQTISYEEMMQRAAKHYSKEKDLVKDYEHRLYDKMITEYEQNIKNINYNLD